MTRNPLVQFIVNCGDALLPPAFTKGSTKKPHIYGKVFAFIDYENLLIVFFFVFPLTRLEKNQGIIEQFPQIFPSIEYFLCFPFRRMKNVTNKITGKCIRIGCLRREGNKQKNQQQLLIVTIFLHVSLAYYKLAAIIMALISIISAYIEQLIPQFHVKTIF